jgi:hypothetical protein
MPLTAGVLIIGSLLWDSEEERPTWRNARLDIASAQAVTAPIFRAYLLLIRLCCGNKRVFWYCSSLHKIQTSASTL